MLQFIRVKGALRVLIWLTGIVGAASGMLRSSFPMGGRLAE